MVQQSRAQFIDIAAAQCGDNGIVFALPFNRYLQGIPVEKMPDTLQMGRKFPEPFLIDVPFRQTDEFGLKMRTQLHEARVVIKAHSEAGAASAQALVEQINTNAGSNVAHPIHADVSMPHEARMLVVKGAEWLDGPDIEVSNAGVESTVSALDLDLDDWESVMYTTLRGDFVCRQAAPMMTDQGQGGVILITSSIYENASRLELTHYGISKAGLRMMSKALALALAEHGIRVRGVAHGAIETDANKREIAAFGKGQCEEWIPLLRLGTSAEVAKTAAFLVSDDAGYVNLTSLEIDGGYVLNLVWYVPRKG